MKRQTIAAGLILALAAASAGGWLLGSRTRSPADLAAAAEPPSPSNITVAVTRQVLSSDVATRGDIVFGDPIQIDLSGSFAEQPARLVVTEAAEVDAVITEGGVVVEVVGRPVFLLAGEIPMYRDLGPGAVGDDVLQLERALKRLGVFEEEADDTWATETGAAIAAWYENEGYRPNGISEEDEAALKALRSQVASSAASVLDIEAAIADLEAGPGSGSVAAARAEIEAAEAALVLVTLDADHAKQLAVTAAAEAEAARTAAEANLEEAEAALATGLAADPPLDPEEIEALSSAVEEAEAELKLAAEEFAEATFQAERTAIEQQALIDAASGRVHVAEAFLSDLETSVDTSSLDRQLAFAKANLEDLREELATRESKLGIWLPAGEIVIVKSLPVRVDRVATGLGEVITGPFATVSSSQVAVELSIAEADASRVNVGMSAEIDHPETGATLSGSVTYKADRTGTNGVASDRVYVVVTPRDLPEDVIGSNVRIIIPVSSTGGAVLAVPAAALSATADGSTIVQVETTNLTLRTVKVETGLAAQGLVEVTPLEGALDEGDLVVVGYQDLGDAGSPEE